VPAEPAGAGGSDFRIGSVSQAGTCWLSQRFIERVFALRLVLDVFGPMARLFPAYVLHVFGVVGRPALEVLVKVMQSAPAKLLFAELFPSAGFFEEFISWIAEARREGVDAGRVPAAASSAMLLGAYVLQLLAEYVAADRAAADLVPLQRRAAALRRRDGLGPARRGDHRGRREPHAGHPRALAEHRLRAGVRPRGVQRYVVQLLEPLLERPVAQLLDGRADSSSCRARRRPRCERPTRALDGGREPREVGHVGPLADAAALGACTWQAPV
jgi:hypothetical protein